MRLKGVENNIFVCLGALRVENAIIKTIAKYNTALKDTVYLLFIEAAFCMCEVKPDWYSCPLFSFWSKYFRNIFITI